MGNARLNDWSIDPTTGTASTTQERRNDREVDACGRCHARRAVSADYEFGKPLVITTISMRSCRRPIM